MIVVAANDGVKPQTEEAIDHAKAAEVPIVVAVNKIDKEGAQPERVRTEMAQHGPAAGGLGGDTKFVDVREDPRGAPEPAGHDPGRDGPRGAAGQPRGAGLGTVIESKLDPGRGRS